MGSQKAVAPTVPLPQTLARALAGSDSLAALASRLAESDARHAAVSPLLPEALAREVRPGPIDVHAHEREQRVVATATDAAGNTATDTWRFKVRRG